MLGTGSQPRLQPQSYGNQDLFYHQIFEAKLPFVLRYMVDHDIVGCNWLQLNPGKYRLLSPSEKAKHCIVR